MDVMNTGLSSFDRLRERYPEASPRLWQVFLQIRLATCMPTSLLEEPADLGEYSDVNLPFVGRQSAIIAALPHVLAHVASSKANGSPLSRGGNAQLFVVGAPGIGKTRFGIEFPKLLKKYGPTQLKDKLRKVCTVRITFQSNMEINPLVDKKWRTEREQVNWILTSRAIFTTYKCNGKYEDWADNLSKLLGDELPSDFNLMTFTHQLEAIDRPTAIYYHMDEVQQLLNEPSIGGDLIRTLTNLYASENKSGLLTLLLYTGTILAGIQELVQTVKVGKSPHFPIVNLPIESLSESEVFSIIEQLKASNKLPWLRDNWKEDRAVLKLLTYVGGVPRILEELIFLQQVPSNSLGQLASDLVTKIQGRYQLSATDDQWMEANWIALAGKPLLPVSANPASTQDTQHNSQFQKKLEELQAQGYIFFNGNSLFVPLVHIRLALQLAWRQFVSQDPVQFSSSNTYLNGIWKTLIDPDSALTWSHFEAFSLLHTVLRANALVKLGESSMRVQEYFNHAMVPASLKDLVIKISQRQFIKISKRWPKNTIPTFPSDETASNTQVEPSMLLTSVFLNATGAICDGFEFAEVVTQGSAPEFLIFAHQNKHTADGKTRLYTHNIETEQTKVQNAFDDWKQRISQIPKYAQFKNSRVVLVVFTNREIRGSQSAPENVIIVSNSAYFGPFQSLLKFFTANKKNTAQPS